MINSNLISWFTVFMMFACNSAYDPIQIDLYECLYLCAYESAIDHVAVLSDNPERNQEVVDEDSMKYDEINSLLNGTLSISSFSNKQANFTGYFQDAGISSSSHSVDEIVSRLHNINNAIYYGKLGIGTPPQILSIEFDTGSSSSWILDLNCSGDGCSQTTGFDQSKSTTFRTEAEPWEAGYADGTIATGYIIEECISIRSGINKYFKLCNVSLAMATSVSGILNQHIDGIFGLSFNSVPSNKSPSPLFAALQQHLFKTNLFTVHFGNKANKNASSGAITFGGLDTKNCGPLIAYEQLTSASFWQFQIRGVEFGNISVVGSYQAISDTGTTHIVGPPDIIYRMLAEVKAEYNPIFDLHLIDCNSNHKPPIHIVIGSKIYTIRAENYISEVEDLCIVGLSPEPVSGISSVWILGTVFIREYCQIHDIENQRIGFAHSKIPTESE